MIRVLIADDEELIRKLIKRLVDWDALGMEVVAEAGDGYTAYNLMVEYEPDIVIADIRMPGIDGLNLARKIHKINPNIAFMLVSGYQEFEYAQEALKLCIKDYILKPIRKDELTGSLSRIRDAILNANKTKASHDEIRFLAERISARMRLQFLKDIVIHHMDSQGFSIGQINHEYGYHFSEGLFQFIFFKCSGSSKKETLPPLDDGYLYGSLAAKLLPLCYDVEHFFYNHKLCILMNYPEERRTAIQRKTEEFCAFIKNSPAFWGYAPFTTAMGNSVKSVSSLQNALLSAADCLDSRFFLGPGRFLTAEREQVRPFKEELILKSDERRFYELLELHNGAYFKQWTSEMLSRAFAHPERPSLVTELSCSIAEMFRGQEKTPSSHPIEALSSWETLYDSIHAADYRTELEDAFHILIDTWYNTEDVGVCAYVRFAKEYIQKNYKKNIRLTDIAQAENLNPSYLSRIFKETTGKTFSDYLTFYRMEIAKELLRDISVNISEVALAVGYCDSKHFSKSFKKVVGITPKEYRNLHAC